MVKNFQVYIALRYFEQRAKNQPYSYGLTSRGLKRLVPWCI